MPKLKDEIKELVLRLEYVESILEEQPGDVVPLEEEKNEILKQIIVLARSGLLKADVLYSSVGVLGLPIRTHKCLANKNIHIILDLIQKTETDILSIQGIGNKSLKKISKSLDKINLKLGTKLD